MMVQIVKSRAQGTVQAPGSKSMSHRLLIGAALAQGESILHNVEYSQDVLATMDCLRALGAEIRCEGSTVHVKGTDVLQAEPKTPLDCRDSASTLRFLIPLALLCGKKVRFTGSKTLLSRPLSVYETLKESHKFFFERDEEGIWVQGPFQRGYCPADASISSQFISGLLFAMPLLQAERMGSRLHMRGNIESRPYIEMTRDALKQFGVKVFPEDPTAYVVPSSQHYTPGEFTVEGDWSAAAFMEALRVLHGNVEVTGLSENSLQGDKVCKQLLERLQAGHCEINLSQCPDLGPVLIMAAAALHGAVFTGTHRLRIKESDRANAMKQELEKCGGRVTVEEGRVAVEKAPLHAPDMPIDSHHDHRIVMAMSVLLTVLGGSIRDAECVEKSYPRFFEDLEKLHVVLSRS
ncbi:MAG: 3-phosphoshikimate 1-carboxyvinyltransferase [Clostridia bacterium]|nr:3-phosphoshikimate 1-carboxyvinyltransferase [Clostridia bacterium]